MAKTLRRFAASLLVGVVVAGRSFGPTATINAASPPAACSNPVYKIFGANLSLYEGNQDPGVDPHVSPDQIADRIQLIAPCTTWVRSFSVTNGLDAAASIA